MEQKTLLNKLGNIKKLDKEIKVINLEIQHLISGIFTQSTLTDTKVKASKTKDMADKYNSLLERKEKLLNRINSLMLERDSLIGLIDDNLEDPEQRTILRLFFVLNMNADEIAEYLDVTKKTVYVHRQQAIKQLASMV
ncbi:MAG: DUF1492 domain-containing protein [Streptococcus lutetiensis]|nr:DUF1492 domain-containing protein [Streptococcus lutetiensis]MDU2622871.1 DUF1492 domain-containing protein [Streptococcus lutetiensis]MDU2675596.1 DUF1492 domain-containing protein [Streptococcus lutetiensis]